MKKYLPYIILVIAAVMITKTIDWSTDNTDELERDKKELIENVNVLIKKYQNSELNIIQLEKDIKVKETIIKAYEIKNDSAIAIMHNGTREQRDSVSTALIGRLLTRQHAKAPH